MSETASPPRRQSSLPGEINTATRSLHTNLNRLITSRLPLAIPPYATDPTHYTTGLLHFSYIYLTFESLWTDLVPTPTDTPSSPLLSFLLVNPYDSPEAFSSTPSSATLHFLRHLAPKGLARSTRIKRDLEYLTGLHPTDLDVLLAQYPGPKVAEFCAHIRDIVKRKPHVLLAYAWCYYMAIFSGGRWIRAQLAGAGDAFWRANTLSGEKKDATASLEEAGLALWHFDGENDGEDIKAEFKRRLLGAEGLFTDDERVDVIEEAKQIFKFSAGLVEELDGKLGTDSEMLERVAKGALGEKAELVADDVTLEGSRGTAVMWFRRPEVTGAVVAFGCLAYVVLKLDLAAFW